MFSRFWNVMITALETRVEQQDAEIAALNRRIQELEKQNADLKKEVTPHRRKKQFRTSAPDTDYDKGKTKKFSDSD